MANGKLLAHNGIKSLHEGIAFLPSIIAGSRYFVSFFVEHVRHKNRLVAKFT